MMSVALHDRIAGTTIDPRSLLSTDYFNHFNEVIMFLGMLPDMPEMLDDIDAWQPKSYCQHFEESGLDFAPLAVEAYHAAAPEVRARLDKVAQAISAQVAVARMMLRDAQQAGETEKFKDLARFNSNHLQNLIDYAAAIVHGYGGASDQSAIDRMF